MGQPRYIKPCGNVTAFGKQALGSRCRYAGSPRTFFSFPPTIVPPPRCCERVKDARRRAAVEAFCRRPGVSRDRECAEADGLPRLRTSSGSHSGVKLISVYLQFYSAAFIQRNAAKFLSDQEWVDIPSLHEYLASRDDAPAFRLCQHCTTRCALITSSIFASAHAMHAAASLLRAYVNRASTDFYEAMFDELQYQKL